LVLPTKELFGYSIKHRELALRACIFFICHIFSLYSIKHRELVFLVCTFLLSYLCIFFFLLFGGEEGGDGDFLFSLY
jgi:hypothetical protein